PTITTSPTTSSATPRGASSTRCAASTAWSTTSPPSPPARSSGSRGCACPNLTVRRSFYMSWLGPVPYQHITRTKENHHEETSLGVHGADPCGRLHRAGLCRNPGRKEPGGL